MNRVGEARSNEDVRSAESLASQRYGGGRQFRETVLHYIVVAAGSVIGSLLRALASLAALAWAGPAFPWGTLFVNIVGSFVIGFYATITGPDGRVFASTYQRQFVMTGLCGGFTTFSIFSLETFQTLHAGRFAAAGLYVGVSVIAWLASVWIGHALASRLNRLERTT